jgi:RNA polymerase sigma-70 factor (sigma-E family)
MPMGRREHDQSYAEFVTGSWARLNHAAFLLTHDRHEAEELVQSVLVKTYASWPRVQQLDAYAYTYRSVVNAFIDRYRRRATLRELPAPAGPAGEPVATVDDRDEILRLLAGLSPRERSIVVLRYYLDRPEAEVADMLGVSTGTVKSTASRALAKLRVSVTEDTNSEGALR